MKRANPDGFGQGRARATASEMAGMSQSERLDSLDREGIRLVHGRMVGVECERCGCRFIPGRQQKVSRCSRNCGVTPEIVSARFRAARLAEDRWRARAPLRNWRAEVWMVLHCAILDSTLPEDELVAARALLDRASSARSWASISGIAASVAVCPVVLAAVANGRLSGGDFARAVAPIAQPDYQCAQRAEEKR